MKLSLRLNHFFRSFWGLNKVLDFTFNDVKYLDLSILTRYELRQWYVGFYKRNHNLRWSKLERLRAVRKKNRYLDVSYWDTCTIHTRGFFDSDTHTTFNGDDTHTTNEDVDKDVDNLFCLKTIDIRYEDLNLIDLIYSIYTMGTLSGKPLIMYGVKNHRIDNVDHYYIIKILSSLSLSTQSSSPLQSLLLVSTSYTFTEDDQIYLKSIKYQYKNLCRFI
jgi:hypothetical protein